MKYKTTMRADKLEFPKIYPNQAHTKMCFDVGFGLSDKSTPNNTN